MAHIKTIVKNIKTISLGLDTRYLLPQREVGLLPHGNSPQQVNADLSQRDGRLQCQVSGEDIPGNYMDQLYPWVIML